MQSLYAHILGKKTLSLKNRNAFARHLDSISAQNLVKSKKDSKKSLITNREKTYSIFPRCYENGLSQNLYKLWLDGQLCDVELTVGKDSIKAHKVSAKRIHE